MKRLNMLKLYTNTNIMLLIKHMSLDVDKANIIHMFTNKNEFLVIFGHFFCVQLNGVSQLNTLMSSNVWKALS